MKDKGIFVLKAGNKERKMHYITEGDTVYALTLNDSKKIEDINKDPNVEVTFNLKGGEGTQATTKIIEDQNKITELFNKMLEGNNTHFKDFDDRIVALEINLK